jgi:hypothetical protein
MRKLLSSCRLWFHMTGNCFRSNFSPIMIALSRWFIAPSSRKNSRLLTQTLGGEVSQRGQGFRCATGRREPLPPLVPRRLELHDFSIPKKSSPKAICLIYLALITAIALDPMSCETSNPAPVRTVTVLPASENVAGEAASQGRPETPACVQQQHGDVARIGHSFHMAFQISPDVPHFSRSFAPCWPAQIEESAETGTGAINWSSQGRNW